jgi:hypothetical protein
MGNTVARVDPCGLPSPVTQSIDEKELRPTLSRWTLREISSLRRALLREHRRLHVEMLEQQRDERRQQRKKELRQLRARQGGGGAGFAQYDLDEQEEEIRPPPFSFELEVRWPTFFKAFEDVSDRVEERVKQASRRSFHSSCHAYAMVRKTRNLEEDGTLAPLGDDDAMELPSVAAAQSEQAAAAAQAKPTRPVPKWRYTTAGDGGGGDAAAASSAKAKMDELLQQKMAELEDPSEQELAKIIDDPRPPGTSGVGSGTATVLKKKAVPVRKTWNPAVISPVFFGYTLAKAAQEDEKQLRLRRVRRQEEVRVQLVHCCWQLAAAACCCLLPLRGAAVCRCLPRSGCYCLLAAADRRRLLPCCLLPAAACCLLLRRVTPRRLVPRRTPRAPCMHPHPTLPAALCAHAPARRTPAVPVGQHRHRAQASGVPERARGRGGEIRGARAGAGEACAAAATGAGKASGDAAGDGAGALGLARRAQVVPEELASGFAHASPATTHTNYEFPRTP